MSGPAPTQREYWNSAVAQQWADQADRMDRTLLPVTEAAFSTLALEPGERVLDIGCGAGATTLMAASEVGASGNAIGVDISRPLLDLARERAANARNVAFVEADAGAQSIEGPPFDAALSRFGLMFFDDPAAAFAKLRQNLRADGRLVFVCWRPFEENLWTYLPLQSLKHMLSKPVTPADPNAPGPFALADRTKIETLLTKSGWREIAVTPWDGDLRIGADARDAAQFQLKIGPCARAVADQELDQTEAEEALVACLSQHETPSGVSLPGACWIVRALA